MSLHKILFSSLLLIFCISNNANSQNFEPANKKAFIAPQKLQDIAPVLHFPNFSEKEEIDGFKFKAIKDVWYNYNSAISVLSGHNYFNGASIEYLFCDTALNVKYSNGTFKNAYFLGVGAVLDPSSEAFYQSDAAKHEINQNLDYTWDSLGFLFGYVQQLEDKIVDTLRFEFFNTEDLYIDNQGGFYIQNIPNNALNQYADTLRHYYLSVNVVNGRHDSLTFPHRTFDVLLDTASNKDTLTGGWLYKQIPIEENIKKGLNIGVYIRFIPGFNYNKGDTLNQKNYVAFLTGEQNLSKTNTYPYYLGDKSNVDYNSAHLNYAQFFSGGTSNEVVLASAYFLDYIMETDKTNPNPGGWPYEWLPLDFKLKYDDKTIGIEENTFNVSDVKSFPNPTNDFVNIAYSVKSDNVVTINIFDQTGKLITSENSNNKLSVGKYVHQINVSNYSKGYYTYTVNGVAGKFIVK